MLVEIGASGGPRTRLGDGWPAIPIGIAFRPRQPADAAVHEESAGYRKLHVFAAAARAEHGPGRLAFNPFSLLFHLLRPNAAALADWDFARLLETVENARPASRACRLPTSGGRRVGGCIEPKPVPAGIDLRLFQSLGEDVCRRVLRGRV